jgi:DNA-directed RNA polymerase specialized sigma24 family protein
MLVDPQVLHRARKGRRDAVAKVLASQYAACHRIAMALSGRRDVGERIVAHVLKQAINVVPTWADEAAPQRWFWHHTVLTVRLASRWKPSADSDTLAPGGDDASYAAFVRALRSLPPQQLEAFILSECEQLNPRAVAVAMDCSTTAAEVHLRQARGQLEQLTDDQFKLQTEKLCQTYHGLTPDPDMATSRTVLVVRRHIWPRTVRRILRWMLVLSIAAALGWLVWRYWREIESAVRSILSTSQPA